MNKDADQWLKDNAETISRLTAAPNRQDDDGAVHVHGGCDWVTLDPHPVTGGPQITA